MVIGIYARKSVYRDNSDSVALQVSSCKNYAKLIFSDKELSFQVYDKDEGFSGKNTDRPSFHELMRDIRSDTLDVVMVYKLDRISRSVKDFSETYELMHAHDVAFLSVKESFDTSTPIGRTVMYILAAFAQLERENTSERVTDSMYALGASGKWTGGKTPAGMTSVRKVVGDKEHSYLVVDPNRICLVKYLAEQLLSGYSITKLERCCRENGIKSETGKYLNTSQIYFILSNPVYCCNDLDAYHYFKKRGHPVPAMELFDGQHGLIAYGRTKQTNGTQKKEHYSVSIGIHEPVFTGAEWIRIQERFGLNKMFRSSKYESGILKGVLKCSCGSRMDVRTSIKNGIEFSYYYCAKMHRQGKAYCNSGYTRVEKLDSAFIQTLKVIPLAPESIPLSPTPSSPNSEEKLYCELKTVNSSIENLTSVLMNHKDSSALSYILSKIENLDREKKNLEGSIQKVRLAAVNQQTKQENRTQIYHRICILLEQFNLLTYREQNELIRKLVKTCTFDGTCLTIRL